MPDITTYSFRMPNGTTSEMESTEVHSAEAYVLIEWEQYGWRPVRLSAEKVKGSACVAATRIEE